MGVFREGPLHGTCTASRQGTSGAVRHLAVLLDAVKVGADAHVAVHAVPLQVVKLVDIQPVPPVGHDLRNAAALLSAFTTPYLMASPCLAALQVTNTWIEAGILIPK